MTSWQKGQVSDQKKTSRTTPSAAVAGQLAPPPATPNSTTSSIAIHLRIPDSANQKPQFDPPQSSILQGRQSLPPLPLPDTHGQESALHFECKCTVPSKTERAAPGTIYTRSELVPYPAHRTVQNDHKNSKLLLIKFKCQLSPPGTRKAHPARGPGLQWPSGRIHGVPGHRPLSSGHHDLHLHPLPRAHYTKGNWKQRRCCPAALLLAAAGINALYPGQPFRRPAGHDAAWQSLRTPLPP